MPVETTSSERTVAVDRDECFLDSIGTLCRPTQKFNSATRVNRDVDDYKHEERVRENILCVLHTADPSPRLGARGQSGVVALLSHHATEI